MLWRCVFYFFRRFRCTSSGLTSPIYQHRKPILAGFAHNFGVNLSVVYNNAPFNFTHVNCISTLKRRVFKIKRHKKKKRKKRWSRMSLIPWKAPKFDKTITYQMPSKMRRIVKERRRRNKGNRTLRIPRQR